MASFCCVPAVSTFLRCDTRSRIAAAWATAQQTHTSLRPSALMNLSERVYTRPPVNRKIHTPELDRQIFNVQTFFFAEIFPPARFVDDEPLMVLDGESHSPGVRDKRALCSLCYGMECRQECRAEGCCTASALIPGLCVCVCVFLCHSPSLILNP